MKKFTLKRIGTKVTINDKIILTLVDEERVDLGMGIFKDKKIIYQMAVSKDSKLTVKEGEEIELNMDLLTVVHYTDTVEDEETGEEKTITSNYLHFKA